MISRQGFDLGGPPQRSPGLRPIGNQPGPETVPRGVDTSIVVTGIQRDGVGSRSFDRDDPRGRIGAVEQDLGRQRLRIMCGWNVGLSGDNHHFEYTPRGFSTMARFARLATGVLDTIFPPRCAVVSPARSVGL